MKFKDLMNLTEEELEKRLSEFLAASRDAKLPPPEKCGVCGKWFQGSAGPCPDAEDHERLGVKCCHWAQIEVSPVEPAVEPPGP